MAKTTRTTRTPRVSRAPQPPQRDLLLQILQYESDNAKDISDAVRDIAIIRTKIEAYEKVSERVDSLEKCSQAQQVSMAEIKKDVGTRSLLISILASVVTLGLAWLITWLTVK